MLRKGFKTNFEIKTKKANTAAVLTIIKNTSCKTLSASPAKIGIMSIIGTTAIS
jgi:hypothetical protein